MRGDHRTFFWIPLCLLANAAIVFAVVESPYGSLGFFDDTPTTSDWALPMGLGAVSGLLQGLAFGWRTALVSSGLTLLGGATAFLFVFPTANTAIGAAIGAVAALLVGRWRARPVRVAALVLLTVLASAAAVYGTLERADVVASVGGLTKEIDLEAFRPDLPESCAGHDLFL